MGLWFDSRDDWMATPYALIALEEVSSTQDVAAVRAAGVPLLVVAVRQSAGRGRLGRTWETAPRALAASLAVRPRGWPVDAFPRISLVAALAACTVLERGVAAKWPNDLVRDDAKVAGLLAEASGPQIVIGLGVNLWWPDAPPGIGALFEEDPGPDVHRRLAERWADDLLERLAAGPGAWGRAEYRSLCRTIGRTIRWKPEGEGVARDVDDAGRLVVDTRRGEVRLSSGEVWEVR